MLGFMSFLAYVWRIFVNLMMLLIIAVTLSGARGRFESTVISLLGLIYITIRSVGIGHAMIYFAFGNALDAELTQIRELLGDSRLDHQLEVEETKKISRGKIRRLYVDSAFLSIAFIIFLIALLTAKDPLY